MLSFLLRPVLGASGDVRRTPSPTPPRQRASQPSKPRRERHIRGKITGQVSGFPLCGRAAMRHKSRLESAFDHKKAP